MSNSNQNPKKCQSRRSKAVISLMVKGHNLHKKSLRREKQHKLHLAVRVKIKVVNLVERKAREVVRMKMTKKRKRKTQLIVKLP